MLSKPHSKTLEKSQTGIKGLDEILNGGLPKGRPTLICGGPGCGKTLIAMEFLSKGASLFQEPGVFLSFEETPEDLGQNFASLGIDLDQLAENKQVTLDYVHIDRNEIEETGEYNLEGLFIRLEDEIDAIGAKRVVLDTIEALFSGFNEAILRSEISRLFHWLKAKGVTAVITAERGSGQLTRYGLEEYVSDCVIVLEHRVKEQIASRYLRVLKYRGSPHSTDEYPFLIDEQGIWVLPITSLGLDYPVSEERILTGVSRLDSMLGGKGYYRGTSILVSGTAGSGKTSLSVHFIQAACLRGEKCLYFAFEEPPSQIIRNMRSIGIDLEPWVKQDLLRFHAVRPTKFGIEMHLLIMQQMVEEFRPQVVVVDPITNLMTEVNAPDVNSMMVRLIDFLKMEKITTMFTSLTSGDANEMTTEVGISSLMDTWLLVRYLESNGERNRGLFVLKARGIDHSNQIREFCLSSRGIELLDVYLGSNGLLTGSARVAHEAESRIAAQKQALELDRKKRELAQKQQEVSNQIQALQASFKAAQEELELLEQAEQQRQQISDINQSQLAQSRRADSVSKTDPAITKNEG